tara:strand:+ start:969 stop:1478 length:510 start_codon:yes stop_codon:yes gene_type:complete
MSLLEHYLQAEREEILGNDIRLMHSGDVDRLPQSARAALFALEQETSRCQGMWLNLALSYGARQELVRAARLLAEQVQAGSRSLESLDEAALESVLYTAGLPELDLLVRTGGDYRLSNFLLWQVAYSELYVTDVAWPDFREPQLLAAIEEFNQRQRRYGLTGAQVEEQL